MEESLPGERDSGIRLCVGVQWGPLPVQFQVQSAPPIAVQSSLFNRGARGCSREEVMATREDRCSQAEGEGSEAKSEVVWLFFL